MNKDDSRDIQESYERTIEAERRQYEANQRKGGTLLAEAVKERNERERQARIKRNDRELERLEAQQGIILGKAKRPRVISDAELLNA